MSSISRRDCLCASVPVLSGVLLVNGLWLWSQRRPEEPAPDEGGGPSRRYTREQMLARSEPICRALAPQETALRLEAERNDAAPSEQSSGRYWDVYARGASGEHVLYLKWDEDTGEVWMASCRNDLPIQDEGPPLPEQEIVRAGRKCLHVLWARPDGAPWRLVQIKAPVPGDLNREMLWRRSRHSARIIVNRYTGALFLAKCKQDDGPPV